MGWGNPSLKVSKNRNRPAAWATSTSKPACVSPGRPPNCTRISLSAPSGMAVSSHSAFLQPATPPILRQLFVRTGGLSPAAISTAGDKPPPYGTRLPPNHFRHVVLAPPPRGSAGGAGL